MSTGPTDSKPPAWLTFLAPLALSALMGAGTVLVGWTLLGTRMDAAERRDEQYERELAGLREWRGKKDVNDAEAGKDLEAIRKSNDRIEQRLLLMDAREPVDPPRGNPRLSRPQ